jgi:hypothetical protein
MASLPKALPHNPFRPGAGTKPEYLAGRTREKEEFERALRQGPLSQNLIITGLRGVGKTVLLDELKPLAQASGWLWAGNDLTETASLSENNLATRLVVDLTSLLSPLVVYRQEELPFGFISNKSRKNERSLEFRDLWNIYNSTPGFSLDKLKAVLIHVSTIIATTDLKGMVVAYDEAQNMSDRADSKEYPLSVIVDLFSGIQKLNLKCSFLLVLSALPTLVPKLNEARTYTERMFHTIILDRLNEDDTRDAITKPIEQTKSTLTFAERTIEIIIRESRGYPFLIQYICKEVFDSWIGKMSVGAAPSVPMTEITAKLDQDFFAPRWSRATDRQQIFMQVIATLPNSDDEFTVPEITKASRELLRNPFSPSHAIQMLGHLSEKGLIYRNRRGTYCFAVPLLSKFIGRQIWDPASLRDQAR